VRFAGAEPDGLAVVAEEGEGAPVAAQGDSVVFSFLFVGKRL